MSYIPRVEWRKDLRTNLKSFGLQRLPQITQLDQRWSKLSVYFILTNIYQICDNVIKRHGHTFVCRVHFRVFDRFLSIYEKFIHTDNPLECAVAMMFHSYLMVFQIMSMAVNFSLALICAYMFPISLNMETGQT